MHFAQGVSTVSLALVRLIHLVPLRMAQRADLARVWADCERKYQERMPIKHLDIPNNFCNGCCCQEHW